MDESGRVTIALVASIVGLDAPGGGVVAADLAATSPPPPRDGVGTRCWARSSSSKSANVRASVLKRCVAPSPAGVAARLSGLVVSGFVTGAPRVPVAAVPFAPPVDKGAAPAFANDAVAPAVEVTSAVVSTAR